jgi:Domain of unknown function (DUF4772)
MCLAAELSFFAEFFALLLPHLSASTVKWSPYRPFVVLSESFSRRWTMSTGKRLAKRSIVGTRVCVPKDDFFLPGVIHAVKSSPGGLFNTGENKYSVRLDAPHPRTVSEYMEKELVGPGFRSIAGLSLKEGQRVFLTHNGREVSATLVVHTRGDNKDEVTVNLNPSGMEVSTLSDPVFAFFQPYAGRLYGGLSHCHFVPSPDDYV